MPGSVEHPAANKGNQARPIMAADPSLWSVYYPHYLPVLSPEPHPPNTSLLSSNSHTTTPAPGQTLPFLFLNCILLVLTARRRRELLNGALK
jgi:hypothetical protein